MILFVPGCFGGELFSNTWMLKNPGKEICKETSIKEEILLLFSEPLSGRMQERISMRFTRVVCHYYFVRNEENPKSYSLFG